MSTRSYSYPFHLWILTIAGFAPVMLGIYTIIKNEGSLDISFLLLMVVFSAAFTLPVIIPLMIGYGFLAQRMKASTVAQVLLVAISIAIVIVFFHVLGGSLANLLTVIYSCSVVLAAILLSVVKPGNPK